MSAWQKLPAAAWEGVKQSGSAAYDLVVAPLLSWEGALTLVGLTVLLLIPYVGQVVLVGLAGVAIYDLLKNVTHLFKEYYDRAVGATSWSELRSAGKLFAQAVVGGLLDVLGIFVGASALARLRALRVAGKLTVGTWLALVEEQAQALRVRLRGGIKNFADFVKEKQQKQQPQAKPKPVPTPKRTHTFKGHTFDIDSSPIKIPPGATVIDQTKVGYDQVKFNWVDSNGIKYEARWHTRTPGAPATQGDTWVITKTTPSTPTGQTKKTEVLTGNGTWTTKQDWKAASDARINGTATTAQEKILDNGHWPAY